MILNIILGVASAVILYLIISLILTYLVHQYPRRPVKDTPDWGIVLDKKIPSIDGGFLEVWRIDPPGQTKGIVLLAHGWGRNRDRMVPRARMFGKMGYAVVIHSARDHGGSSKCRFMNARKFAEDIESVLKRVDSPVILYGHSAGAVGAIIAAHRNAEKVRLLFLEACYSETKPALKQLYTWANRVLGVCFAPMILFWMDLFYEGKLEQFSPKQIAPNIRMPVLLIHGEKDRRFPVRFAVNLKNAFPSDQCELFIAKGANHSNSSEMPGYKQAVRRFLDKRLKPY